MEQKRIPISNQEILEKLKTTISKIELLCNIYDKGEIDIYLELSVKLRVLFHSTNNCKSLIRLAKLEHISFIDTAHKYSPNNLAGQMGLLAIHMGNKDSGYMALKHLNGHKSVDYENWWNGKKVLSDKFKKTFTRKDIICNVADTDGGAHVDPSISIDYNEISRNNSLNWFKTSLENGSQSMGNPIPECIRQIAYEVIITFQNINIEKSTKLYIKE